MHENAIFLSESNSHRITSTKPTYWAAPIVACFVHKLVLRPIIERHVVNYEIIVFSWANCLNKKVIHLIN